MKYLYVSLVCLLMACDGQVTREIPAPTDMQALSKTFIEPHNGYSEAVVVSQGDLTTIYVSGQVGEGDSFEAQFRDAIGKLKKTLSQSGATFKDVVKMNTYIVDYTPEMLPAFRAVRKELLGDSEMPASTLIGVAALGLDSWKVEIDVMALIERE
ncbi:MAG: RidA family protein [Croceitalea sp.]|nr:RidA family protein [Croceitalea sp.]